MAVPAVWAYNWFTNKVEAFGIEMTNSSSELIDYFLKQKSKQEVTMGMGGGGGRGEVTSEINVTPMADVMLVLLIIFMVVTPMLQKGVTVELAKTKNPIDMKEADRDDAVLVAVTRDGKFYLGQDRVNIDDLATKVNDLVGPRSSTRRFS